MWSRLRVRVRVYMRSARRSNSGIVFRCAFFYHIRQGFYDVLLGCSWREPVNRVQGVGLCVDDPVNQPDVHTW